MSGASGGHEVYLPTIERARAAKAEVRAKVWWRRGPVNIMRWDVEHSEPLAAVLVVARPRKPDLYDDPGARIAYAYVPEIPFALEHGLTELLDPGQHTPPDCLRISLEGPAVRGGPYRGGPSIEPSFHGHRFGDALTQARDVVRGFMDAHGGREATALDTWAWPFLRITFKRFLARREVALVVRPDLNLHAFLGAG